jgi:hypothetical protein
MTRLEEDVTKQLITLAFTALILVSPRYVRAQSNEPDGGNVPAPAQGAVDSIESTARRFRMAVSGGVGLDPEAIDVGVNANFGPIFTRGLNFRPGVELGFGELTTFFAINLDVTYALPGYDRQTRWIPYIGGGPNFAISHQGFSAENGSLVQTTTTTGAGPAAATTTTFSRFDFSDTDFDAGFNFIAGARTQRGTFFEMKATAWGVSNVRLLFGFTF